MLAKLHKMVAKRPGLRCPIRVMSHQGDGCLTTYDPAVEDSAAVATQDLRDFWGQCVDEFKGKGTSLTPVVAGKRVGGSSFDLLTGDEIAAPEFDVGLFDEILVQPVPLTGG
jgi:hypothetical protein